MVILAISGIASSSATSNSDTTNTKNASCAGIVNDQITDAVTSCHNSDDKNFHVCE